MAGVHRQTRVRATTASPPRAVRVLICDDSPEVRAAIAAAIDGWDGFAVVGQAGDAETAQQQLGFSRPDVVVLDVRMPGSALAVAAAANALRQAPAVVVYTTDTGPVDRQALFAAGIDEYVVKTGRLAPLREALHRTVPGTDWARAC